VLVVFAEITRILNHLFLAITTHALDVGALTPFLRAFEEREKLMEFYENVVLGLDYMQLIFVQEVFFADLPEDLLNDIVFVFFCKKFDKRLVEIEELFVL
jgi:NADH:ubiquinone oxidoreductase subunit D